MAPGSKDAEAESKSWIVDVGRVVFQHAQIYLTTPKPKTGKRGKSGGRFMAERVILGHLGR